MTSPRRLVTVGLPTRNRARLLERALDSLLAQDHPRLEIVIADNASQDDTAAVSARVASAHPHVRHERTDSPLPVFQNFRRALLLGRGPYFMWASDDDRWEPAFVSTLLRMLEEDAGLALAVAEARYMLADGTPLPWFREGAAFEAPPADGARARLLHMARHAYGNLVYGLYRREALVTESGATALDEHASVNEIPLLLAVAAQGGVRTCTDVLLHKAIPLPVYLSRAREVGFEPELTDELRTAAAQTRRGGLRWFFRRLRGSAHGTRRHYRDAWRDIVRAIQALPVDPATRRAVHGACLRRVWGHYLRTTVGWTLRDLVRRRGP